MTPDEEVLLRDIGVLLLGNLAGFTAMTLVYGVFVLLFCICCYKLANRGFKNRANVYIFFLCFLTFCVATVYWCAYLGSFATLVRGILVDTDIGPLDTGGSFDGINAKNLRYVRMQNWTAQLLPMFSNGVLIYKLRTLYPTACRVMIAPVFLLAGSIGTGFGLLGVMSNEAFDITGVLGASKLWKDIFISYLSLNLATNMITSLFISAEVARLQADKPNIGSTLKMSQARVVSVILIESGILFVACQAINLGLELVKPTPDSSLYFAGIVLTSVYVICSAMYPTVSLLLFTVQRSIPHLFGQIPIEVKPSSTSSKAAGTRPATMGHLSFAQAATQMGTMQGMTDTTMSNSQIVSFVVNDNPDKTQTFGGILHSDEKLTEEKQIKTI